MRLSARGFSAATVGIFLLTRVVVAVGAWVAMDPAPDRLHRLVFNWDGLWYLDIASYGYDNSEVLDAELRVLCERPDEAGCVAGHADRFPNLAFFPLYAWILRVLVALGLAPIPAAVLVSFSAALSAAILMGLIARDVAGTRVALTSVAIWGCWPVSIVLSIGRPEPLFIALAAGGLLLVLRGRLPWAAAVCVLAGLTRFQAVALIIPVMISAWVAAWRERRWSGAVIVTAVAPAGLVAYLAFVAHRTGTPTGWFAVQRAWQSVNDWGAGKSRYVWDNLVGTGAVHVVAAWTIVLACVLLLALIRMRLPWVLWVYSAVIVGSVLVQAPYHQHSMRFLLAAFPLVLPIAWAVRHWRARTTVLALSVAAVAAAWFQVTLLRGSVSF